MKWIIAIVLVAILLVSGCTKPGIENKRSLLKESTNPNLLNVYADCNDRVVCYWRVESYAGGMDCFRDVDLVKKYCVD